MVNYLLDTNVLSEPSRPRPDPRVMLWLDTTPLDTLYISVLSMGELTKGLVLATKNNNPRAEVYHQWLLKVREQYRDRTLPIDTRIAETWGTFMSTGTGPIIDALLICTAYQHSFTVATRNSRDFANRGVKVFNPWTD